MSSKLRSVNTHFWDDIWIMDLIPVNKLLYIYLFTNSKVNMLGVYELSMRKITFDTGIDSKTVEESFEKFKADRKIDYTDGYVILNNFVKNQRYNSNMIISAYKDLDELPVAIKSLVESGPIMAHLKSKLESLPNPSKVLGRLRKEEEEVEVEIESECESNAEGSRSHGSSFKLPAESPPSLDSCISIAQSIGLPMKQGENYYHLRNSTGWKKNGSMIHSYESDMKNLSRNGSLSSPGDHPPENNSRNFTVL